MFRRYVKVYFILTDRCSSTSRHIPVSRYARGFILPVSMPIIICLTVYDVRFSLIFDLKNKPYVIESLIDEELDFHMHEGTGASP
ncbi:hypothetical protein Hanom_Chr11g00996071 [Helianthus anomalus]